ncbi:MAG: O-antigen ligase family protein [Rubrivivax sp.]|nr:O-antigen ligase family protein [Rubrivivax sp.]
MTTERAAELHPALAVAATWSLFLPLTVQYLSFGACAFGSLWLLWKRGDLRSVVMQPATLALFAWWAWLVASAAWSHAPTHDRLSHAWTYSLVLWVPLIARATTSHTGRLAIVHFVGSASLVAAVIAVDALCSPSGHCAWLPFVGVTGNQRIAYSLLLALAAALAATQALETGPRRRLPWLGAAVLCLCALSLQDRRTGMVLAPALLALAALARLRAPASRTTVLLGIAVSVAVVMALFPQVGARFAEGLAELREYRSQGAVETSWGMRLRMYEVTASLVGERPVAGHGLGSWAQLWRDRVHGGAVLESHSTPHNEYLLVAVQGGWIALSLIGVALGATLRTLWHRGTAALPALLVLTAMLGTGLFNVVLRDAKFALPLLMLAAWAVSVSRADNRAPLGSRPRST